MIVGLVLWLVNRDAGSPSADAAGLFPDRWHHASLTGTLKIAAANKPDDTSFHVSVYPAASRPVIWVVTCDQGDIQVGPGSRPCEGHPAALVCGGQDGQTQQVEATVSQPQRGRWGVAFYEGSPGLHC